MYWIYPVCRSGFSRSAIRHTFGMVLVSSLMVGILHPLPYSCAAQGLFPPAKPRKVLNEVAFDKLVSGNLTPHALPLVEADTRAGRNFAQGHLGRLRGKSGERLFNPQIVLLKFKAEHQVRALRVAPGREWDAVMALKERNDVAFAELDTYEQRQFLPNDPLGSNQWHHAVIGSFEAWNFSRGEPFIRIAIVDTPFQMDHPDLAAHADAGWDLVDEVPVTASNGIDHSTMSAGMAAAVINNMTGVAGAGNCRLVPININGALSEMHDAVIWAADHGVRVVSISWTGGNSDTVNEAAEYLRATARGIVLMPGVNGTGFLDYTNQPYIHCISMTDAADNMRSRFGNHIDFAAPGWDVYSTTIGGGYRFDTGTSYATPLVAGIVAVLMSINPLLTGDEVIELLKQTAQDFGAPDWDQFFGWGRINFSAAAAAASATLPAIRSITTSNGQAMVQTELRSGVQHELWKSGALELADWQRVTSMVAITNGTRITLIDPAPAQNNFYRVRFLAP